MTQFYTKGIGNLLLASAVLILDTPLLIGVCCLYKIPLGKLNN